VKIEEGLPVDPMDEPVSVRVARGVALLDELGPDGWRDRVDLSTLNLMSTEDCVLGQVYGTDDDPEGWYLGEDALNIHSGVSAARYGFDVPYRFGETAVRLVEDEWRRVLAE